MRSAAIFFASMMFGALLRAQTEEVPAGASEIEPPILPGNLTSEKRSDNQPVNLAQLERKLERAKQSASAAERLFKIGALAKVEAENRALRVIRIQSELASAKAEAEKSQEAARAAEVAAENLKKAELSAAELNLVRRKKLYVLGSGGKSMLRRAEEKLTQLKDQQK